MGDLVLSEEISEEDYRAIEEAVMETARGRWFLAEYAKRNRVADTQQVLSAVNSLKSFITREHEPTDALQLRLDIADMAQKIEQIKRDIVNTENEKGEISNAQVELNVVVDETEAATSTILSAAESVQEIAWEVSEKGVDQEYCDKLDALATEIYLACSFQDLTGQRLRKIVQLFAHIEERFQSMLNLWEGEELAAYRTSSEQATEANLANGPALPGDGTAQSDIDTMLAEEDAANVAEDTIEWSEDTPAEADDENFIIEDYDEAELYQATDVVVDDLGTPETDETSFIDEVSEDTPTKLVDEGPAEADESALSEDDDIAAFESDTAEEIAAIETAEPIEVEAADAEVQEPVAATDSDTEPSDVNEERWDMEEGNSSLQSRLAQFT